MPSTSQKSPGAAREQPVVLVFGLLLSIALMGAAASFIAGLLRRHRWIAYVGLAIILYVALTMIWEGMFEIHEAVALAVPWWSLLLELEIFVELAVADHAGHVAADRGQPLLDALGRHVVEQHAVAGQRRHMRYASAHLPGADDAHRLDRASHHIEPVRSVRRGFVGHRQAKVKAPSRARAGW